MGNGWEEQFRNLHGYYRRVYSLFRTLGFDHETAMDLTQETFVRVIQSREAYRGEAKWNYLKKTAGRIAANEWRHRATIKRTGMHLPEETAAARADDRVVPSDERVRVNEEKKRLYAAVEKLDVKAQRIVRLYVAEQSYREIAEIVGISENAVRTALRDIRARLRELVGEELEGFGGDS
jgi:RNA polymerase sigma-70 factor, ECF subfamily